MNPFNTNMPLKAYLSIQMSSISMCWEVCYLDFAFTQKKTGTMRSSVVMIHRHHCLSSVVSRSAVMGFHRSRSRATLIQSLYDIFVHSLVHIVLGLPRPLLPFILPSISNRCRLFLLIIYPKYWHFLFLIVFNNDLLVFILFKTSPLVLCSFHDILNILLYSHISKASNLSDVTLVSVHVSAPYTSVDQI